MIPCSPREAGLQVVTAARHGSLSYGSVALHPSRTGDGLTVPSHARSGGFDGG
jgi:hypothetical protein